MICSLVESSFSSDPSYYCTDDVEGDEESKLGTEGGHHSSLFVKKNFVDALRWEL